jgi:hypothetical protein
MPFLTCTGPLSPGYGAPPIAEFVGRLRDVDLPEPTDDILMGVPESYFSSHPAQRRFRRQLARVADFTPDFVAIIGYSFAQDGTRYDDSVSLNSFLETRRNFRGRIYDLKLCSRSEATGMYSRTPSSESYRVGTVADRSTTFASKRLTDTTITSPFRLIVQNDGRDPFDCMDAIKVGFARNEIGVCKLSAEDQATLDATPGRLRVDHPRFIRRETRTRSFRRYASSFSSNWTPFRAISLRCHVRVGHRCIR